MDLNSFYEALAVIFNLAYVVLAVFQNVLCWPAGLVGAGFTFLVFLNARLYGAMALQIVFIVLMIYGWYKWRRGGEKGGLLVASRIPVRWQFILVFAGIVFAVVLGLFLKVRTDAALPFLDAGTTSFSLVAQFMMTRKWIENWLLWIIVDLVYVGMLVSQQLQIMAALYVAYLILAVIGFVKWRRSLETKTIRETRVNANRVKPPRRVVLIGPECTGKTSLAKELAARYEVSWSPEFAREYAETKAEPLNYEDVEAIGRGQKKGEDTRLARALKLGQPLIVLDTDLVSTMIYSRHYYRHCPKWIEGQIQKRLGDLYLLHHIDIEWEADGHQREQPERREELFHFFRSTLKELGARVTEVKGSWEVRKRQAIESIDYLLADES